MIDIETREILNRQQQLLEVTNHSGWKYVKDIVNNKLSDLQNAFNLEDSDPVKMLNDLTARKLATVIIQDMLREIEGSKEVVQENKVSSKDSYIIKLED